jgi:hypothetical protein
MTEPLFDRPIGVGYAFSILSTLRHNIETVLSASLPNKQQHAAAKILAGQHFDQASGALTERAEKCTPSI